MTEELDPASAAAVAGERATLDGFLDFFRQELVRKVQGLSTADAGRSLVPSATTLAGLIRHLTSVERHWFLRELARWPQERIPANSYGDDASWVPGPADTVASLIADYEATCALSREVAAGFALDHVVPNNGLGSVSCRSILVHMIEETGRHVGHADILREQTDGATG